LLMPFILVRFSQRKKAFLAEKPLTHSWAIKNGFRFYFTIKIALFKMPYTWESKSMEAVGNKQKRF
jgi:hypothetical protein